jgi:putative tricarboxylic transport membrane protein
VPRSRLIAPLAGVALALALYPATWGLDAMARGSLGPGFWPRLALIGLGLACVVKFVEEWRRARAGARVASAVDGPSPISRGKLGLGIASIVLYVVLTPLLGFPLVTALFIAGFMSLCGIRSVAVIVANVGIGTAGLLYLFVKLVYLPLPKGDGPFETLTLALYRAMRRF